MAVAPTIGNIQEYRAEDELFSSYLERVQLFFMANDVADGKKVAVFLSVIGSKTYSLLRSLVAPTLPQDKTFDQLVTVLTTHFEPKPLVIAERFHFHQRSQAVGESISDYIAELRRLTTHCEFGDYLNQSLRDRLVCGLRNEAIQRKLLSEANLTLKRALELAQGMEAAERTAKSMKGRETAVNHLAAKPCYRCGKTSHDHKECKFRDADCHNCGKRGHIASVCRSKPKRPNPMAGQRQQQSHQRRQGHRLGTKYVMAKADETNAGSESPDDEYLPLYTVGGSATPPIEIPLLINNVKMGMELDTGAAVTIISEKTCMELFPDATLRNSPVLLKTYSGEHLPVVGDMDVRVQYEQQTQNLVLTVVAGEGPSLLGRNWLQYLQLNWREIKAVRNHAVGSLDYLLDKYGDIFTDELGTIKSFCAQLDVKPGEKPKFFKPRTVPYAVRSAIEDEIDRLEREGILEKVTHSEWATPIVAVPKPDGRVRLCGDFKVTLNQSLNIDQYPLPKVEDLFATLAGGKKFTKLDLSQAYLQLELHPESLKYCTINTHKGLYQFTRLPFGIASAPAQFQKVMDTILQGVSGAMCYIDDILVTGATEEEHLRNLEEVLRRLQAHGIRMRRSKCYFMQDSVEYLGHRVDAEGLRATPEKIAAIENALLPRNVQQLRSFLGLLNYYRKFLPNLAAIVQPLNDLLQKGKKWAWSPKCSQAVKTAKQLLTTSNLLTHYDPTLPLKLAADASQYGLGAVISHVLPNGVERPVAFASRSLSKSERNYSQIDKEALALVFGVQKFHTYLYGRRFTLVTDHKPLTSILGPKKGVPSVAAARLQRWALLLAAYNYDIEFRSTVAHGNADALSRLPLPEGGSGGPSETQMCNVRQIQMLPVTSQQIRRATLRDPILGKVQSYVLKGWPAQVPKTLQTYHSKIPELSVEDGCLLWGGRVIVPGSLKEVIMAELHKEHMGISKMKALARNHVWWAGLDKDLEALAKSCPACLAVKQTPPNAPLHPWIWPSRPWQRIHIDFAGPFMDKSFFIVVDAHSKWAEVVEMPQTTTARTIAVLRHLFATHGIPEQIVSDNGPQFTSNDFAEFTKTNGIKHTRSSPYHPATNGEAERFVRTFKEAMKTGKGDGLTLAHRVENFLLTYRTTPHATTGTPPCQLLMGRSLRTRWDLLKPDIEQRVSWRQSKQKERYDQHARPRSFHPGQSVMAKNFRSGPDWVPGVIVQQLGPLTYLVDVSNGRLWKRHVDHLKNYFSRHPLPVPETEVEVDLDIPPTSAPIPALAPAPTPPQREEPSVAVNPTSRTSQVPVDSPVIATPNPPVVDPTPRYPARQRHPPDWFHP